MIVHNEKLIYIHIPKCGGCSVEDCFKRLRCDHRTVKNYYSEIGTKWSNYYKFTIIRNPWDRLVSTFFYTRSNGKMWERENMNRYASFKEFVVDVARKLENNLIDELPVAKLYFFPQTTWYMNSERKLLINKVYRLEKLGELEDNLSERLGRKIRFPHVNKSKHRDFRDYYTPEVKELASKILHIDIENLRYSFSGQIY